MGGGLLFAGPIFLGRREENVYGNLLSLPTTKKKWTEKGILSIFCLPPPPHRMRHENFLKTATKACLLDIRKP